MNVDLILVAIALLALVWVAIKAPGPALLLAVSLIGLTYTGVVDIELNHADRIAQDAKDAAHDGAQAVEEQTR
jgi:hypothetical protein